MMTFKQWLNKYGKDSCDGCYYNIPHRAKCTYKGKCIRYDNYKKMNKENFEQLTLF